MKFYYDLLCPPSRAVLIFCNVLKIPILEIPVALRKNEHLTEEFKRNVGKLQRLPILHHEGFSLGESVAIFRYLTKQSEIADPWYPSDVHQRARVDEYLSWTHNNIRVAVGQFIYAKWRDPLMTGKKTDEDTVKYLEKHLDKALDEMNDTWLEKGFMAGDKLTVADIFAACDLEQIKLSGKDAFVGRDRLTSWYKRVVPILEPHFTNHSRFVHKHAEKRMMSSTK